MTAFPRTFRHCAVLVAPLALLSGCISLGGDVPDQLLSLTHDVVPNGTAASGRIDTALVVREPDVPQKLATVRVPVQVDATSIAYVKDAQWIDSPQRLFKSLLIDRIAGESGQLVVSEELAAGRGRETLGGTLVDFGVDASDPLAPRAVMTFDAVWTPEPGMVRQKRFTVSEPLAAVESGPVSVVLNDLANQMAGEVSAWIQN